MKSEKITSTANPKIKELRSLMEKPREREEKGLFVTEGARETLHCLDAGFVPRAVFHSPEISGDGLGKILSAIKENRHLSAASERLCIFEVSPEVYSRIAYREGTEGIVAEVHAKKPMRLDDLRIDVPKTGKEPLVAVIENVEKPGNIGAILRSAEGCGADALIVCGKGCDIYNPNLIRASIGAVFRIPVVTCTTTEAIDWLKKNGILIYTAQLQDSETYYDTDLSKGCAIVLGSEDKGLGNEWREAADGHIRIPMLGRLDSLNVSVSAGILLYEALRQRMTR